MLEDQLLLNAGHRGPSGRDSRLRDLGDMPGHQLVIVCSSFHSFACPFPRCLWAPTAFCRSLGLSDNKRDKSLGGSQEVLGLTDVVSRVKMGHSRQAQQGPACAITGDFLVHWRGKRGICGRMNEPICPNLSSRAKFTAPGLLKT